MTPYPDRLVDLAFAIVHRPAMPEVLAATLQPWPELERVPYQAIRAAAKAVLSLVRKGDTPYPLRVMRGDDAARSLALLCGPQARRNWRSLSRMCRSELTAARWLRQNKEATS